MKQQTALVKLAGIIAGLLLAVQLGIAESPATSSAPQADDRALTQGVTFQVKGYSAKVTKLDTLPYVESEYTKRFKFDSHHNPKLKKLREQHRLDEVVAAGKDEFDQQVLLMDWTHRQFKKFGQPSVPAKGALAILQAVQEDHTFFCAQYAQTFVSCAASMGWVARQLALRRHQGVATGGSTEHSTTEIWSNQHRKWVMLDPTNKLFLEKDGVPLNAYEIRQEWFYNDGRDLTFVIGRERQKYRKSDLPVVLGRFPGFGDLTLNRDELDKYGFTGYIPNTNLMDAREDYAGMFIVKDKLCEGTKWHERTVPTNPATDPYFPIGQAALELSAAGEGILVTVRTLTPNFAKYEVLIDGGNWTASGDQFEWTVRPGLNRLAVRTLNQFGVAGPVSTVEVAVSK